MTELLQRTVPEIPALARRAVYLVAGLAAAVTAVWASGDPTETLPLFLALADAVCAVVVAVLALRNLSADGWPRLRTALYGLNLALAPVLAIWGVAFDASRALAVVQGLGVFWAAVVASNRTPDS